MRLKTRTIAGGLVVAGLVAGTFLSGLMPGFGVGGGNGTQVSSSTGDSASPVETTPAERTDAAVETPVSQKPVEPDSIASSEPPAVLEIRIDGHEYLVPSGADAAFRKAELAEILELAKTTTGNDDGIRVRIVRHKSARVVAWSTLYEELERSGFKRDSIRMPKELID